MAPGQSSHRVGKQFHLSNPFGIPLISYNAASAEGAKTDVKQDFAVSQTKSSAES